jgi:hypothetical protein
MSEEFKDTVAEERSRFVEPSKTQTSTCSECASTIAKAHKVWRGKKFCQSCYARLFKLARCSICGKSCRSHVLESDPVCGPCDRASRSCGRCGRLTPLAALRIGDKVVCPSCAPHFREKKPCSACGALSSRLSRVRGHEEKGSLCPKCQRACDHRTCAICKRHRKAVFFDFARAPICQSCLVNPTERNCADCGAVLHGAGTAPCLPCAKKRALSKKFSSIRNTLQTESTRALLAEFEGWVSRNRREAVASRSFAAVTQFFFKFDGAEITYTYSDVAEWVRTAFSAEAFRRMGIVTMFLTDAGYLLNDAKARSELSASRKIATLLKRNEQIEWSEKLLTFADSLASHKGALSEKTRYSYLIAAENFLRHVNAGQEGKVTQPRLVSFLRQSPGHRASIYPFVHFLSTVCGVQIKVPAKRTSRADLKTLSANLGRILQAVGDAQGIRQRVLVAKALSILFGVPIGSILEMRVEDLDTSVGSASIRVRGEWIPVESYRYLIVDLAQQVGGETPPSQPIFPGRNSGDTLSTAAARHHLLRGLG